MPQYLSLNGFSSGGNYVKIEDLLPANDRELFVITYTYKDREMDPVVYIVNQKGLTALKRNILYFINQKLQTYTEINKMILQNSLANQSFQVILETARQPFTEDWVGMRAMHVDTQNPENNKISLNCNYGKFFWVFDIFSSKRDTKH